MREDTRPPEETIDVHDPRIVEAIDRYWRKNVSVMAVCLFSTLFMMYNYTSSEWYNYYLKILIAHIYTFNVVIYSLESTFQ